MRLKCSSQIKKIKYKEDKWLRLKEVAKLSPPYLKKPAKETASTPKRVTKEEERKGQPHLSVTKKSIVDKEDRWA
tara:strand:+ start:1117 stop:1341 length:225 start_codon:yes stop_codon:yes gene_type:complete